MSVHQTLSRRVVESDRRPFTPSTFFIGGAILATIVIGLRAHDFTPSELATVSIFYPMLLATGLAALERTRELIGPEFAPVLARRWK